MNRSALSLLVLVSAVALAACGEETSSGSNGGGVAASGGKGGASASGGASAGGTSAGGAAQGGSNAGGKAAGGNASGGKAAGGEAAGGNGAGGEAAGGQAAGGEAAGGHSGGHAAGGEAAGGNAAGGEAAGGNAAGGEAAGGNGAGGEAAGGNGAGGEAAAGAGGNAAGGEAQGGGAQGGSSSGGPTTCDDAHGIYGCCEGATLYYFEGGGVQSVDCGSTGAFCGWNEVFSGYDCVDADVGADPSGTYPLACGGSPVAGACDGGAGGAGGGGNVDPNAPKTCDEAHGNVGCCLGDVAYFFANGAVDSIDCAPDGMSCGWIASGDIYGCVEGTPEADPSGTYPLTCGGDPIPGLCQLSAGLPLSA